MAAVIPRASEVATRELVPLRIAAMLGILLAIVAAFWPAAESLGVLWLDTHRTTYAHGFLVLATSGWLLWQARDLWATPDLETTPRKRMLFLGLLAGAVLAWQFAYRAGVQIGIEMLLLPIAWLAIASLLGARAAKASITPIAFLGFALTIWDSLNPLLHWASVHMARLMLRLLGVPAFFEGDLVHIPAGTFEIQGGCSGLHFLIVALAIAMLVGELRADSWQRRIRWLALAAIIALLSNWIRVSTIIFAGHVTDMQAYVVRVSHYGYGWILFALAMALFLYIERRVPLSPPTSHRRAAVPGAAPLNSAGISSVVLLLALPQIMTFIIDGRTQLLGDGATAVGPVTGWSPADVRRNEWQPRQLNADRETRMGFLRDTRHVERFVAEYVAQSPEKKLGGYSSRPQGDAMIIDSGLDQAGGRAVNAMQIEREGRRSILWVSYQVDGRFFADAMRAQLWYGWRTLLTLSSPSARVVAWWTPCETDCAVARSTLREFTTASGGIP